MHQLGESLANYVDTASIPVQILFVDDGSTDGSLASIKQLVTQYPFMHFIAFEHNQGLTTAIKAGIDAADTELVGYIDADLQTSPEDFELLLAELNEHDAAVGYRVDRKDSFSKRIQSKVGNQLRRWLINDGVIDTGCPLKVIRTEVAKNLPLYHGMHRFIPALIQLDGGTVQQVPIRHFPRTTGKSKFTVYNRSYQLIHDILAYRWMRKRKRNYKVKEQA